MSRIRTSRLRERGRRVASLTEIGVRAESGHGTRIARAWLLSFASLSLLFVSLPLQAEGPSDEPSRHAMRVLDEFMAAFNARDEEAMVATLHFPHVRIASGRTNVEASAETLIEGFDFGVFAKRFDWDHSAWVSRKIVQSGPAKVHIATRFARYRADGSISAEFDSLYIVAKRNGRWGIVGRSSFAP